MSYTWRDPAHPGVDVRHWPDLDALAREWWAEEPPYVRESPAHDFVTHQIKMGNGLALEVLQQLIDTSPDAERLIDLGPGPIEDLLVHYGHAESFVDEVEQRVRSDPRWRAAISELWLDDLVPPSIRTRLVALGAT